MPPGFITVSSSSQNNMAITDSKLRRYLLGDLSEDDARETDLSIISNTHSDEDLELAEHELIEDYLEGSLTSGERELFEKNFLISDRRAGIFDELTLLKQYAQSAVPTKSLFEPKTESTENYGFWRRLLGANLVPVTGLAVVILIFLGWISWKVLDNSTDPFKALENEYSDLNARSFDNLEEYRSFTNIDLTPGTFRSSQTLPTFEHAKLSDNVLFRLALPGPMPEGSLINATLRRNNVTVFSQEKLRVYKNPESDEVRLIFPKAVLQPGHFQIKLEGPSSSSPQMLYAFAIQ